jgi:23S rRNA (guanosine2251-2'-O)-methyltransferase
VADLLLEGWVSVLAGLEAGRRHIRSIYVQRDKDVRGLDRIQAAAAKRGVEVKLVSAEEIGGLAQGSSHGGVLAQAGEREFQSLDELASAGNFVAMLDGVEDPYNYGQAVRALYAAGAAGLVVPPRNWDTALNVVSRASAGASEHMPTAVADAQDALAFFKARGFRTAATAKERKSISIYAADLRGSLFMLIGGERRGLNAAALGACDMLVSIPYGREFKAELDVTSSTAALAFEVMRQRAA